MNPQRLLPFFLVFALAGCTTTGTQSFQTYATPANVRIATAIVCSSTLTLAVKPDDRTKIANYIYSIAHVVRSLTTGQVPTPTELQNAVNVIKPGVNDQQWAVLAQSIGAIYGGVFVQIKGDPKLVIDYLNAIAYGCEDAATAFLPQPTASPTP